MRRERAERRRKQRRRKRQGQQVTKVPNKDVPPNSGPKPSLAQPSLTPPPPEPSPQPSLTTTPPQPSPSLAPPIVPPQPVNARYVVDVCEEREEDEETLMTNIYRIADETTDLASCCLGKGPLDPALLQSTHESMRKLRIKLEDCGKDDWIWRKAIGNQGSRSLNITLTGLMDHDRFPTAFIEDVNSVVAYLFGQGSRARHILLRRRRPDGTDESERRICIVEFGTAGLDVGGLLWPAATIMGTRLFEEAEGYSFWGEEPQSWQGKVLELGCGVGPLPSLLLKTMGVGGEVVCSDYTEEVMRYCGKNIARNEALFGSNAPRCTIIDWLELYRDVNLSVDEWKAMLDNPPASQHPEAHSFDVVLGADVLYDAWHGRALPLVISAFLAPTPGARAVVVLGNRFRTLEGVEHLELGMAKMGFQTWIKRDVGQSREYVFRRPL